MHFRKALTSTGRRDKFSIQNNLAWESMEYEYQKEVLLETQRLSSCKGCNFWRFVLGFSFGLKRKRKAVDELLPFFLPVLFHIPISRLWWTSKSPPHFSPKDKGGAEGVKKEKWGTHQNFASNEWQKGWTSKVMHFFAFQSHAYFRLLELQSHPNELKLALGESNKKVGRLWPFTTLKSFLEILQLFIRLFCDFVSEPGKASSKVIQTHLLPFSWEDRQIFVFIIAPIFVIPILADGSERIKLYFFLFCV